MPAELARSERWPTFTLAPPPALGADTAALRSSRRRRSTHTGPVRCGRRAPTLDGVTIVELGSFFAAPFGATLLAEQGSRVVKIEPPEGDAIRNVMPFPSSPG